MALSVVECMKNLANSGKTIVSSIHQPSSEIFKIFDRICLMAEGKISFIGDLSLTNKFFRKYDVITLFLVKSKLFIHYLLFILIRRIGFEIPTDYNPADFYIKTLALLPANKEKCLENIKVI